MVGGYLFKILSLSKNLYSAVAIAIFFAIAVSIFKLDRKSEPVKNIVDYKSISYVKIDYGGGIYYNIYTRNTPVIIKRLRSYEGDILVLYLKTGSAPEIKKVEDRTENGKSTP